VTAVGEENGEATPVVLHDEEDLRDMLHLEKLDGTVPTAGSLKGGQWQQRSDGERQFLWVEQGACHTVRCASLRDSSWAYAREESTGEGWCQRRVADGKIGARQGSPLMKEK
jgi:hypothetical protein